MFRISYTAVELNESDECSELFNDSLVLFLNESLRLNESNELFNY